MPKFVIWLICVGVVAIITMILIPAYIRFAIWTAAEYGFIGMCCHFSVLIGSVLYVFYTEWKNNKI